MTTITRDQAQKIIDAADEVITALAGTNDDVHPDNSRKMCDLWDDLNDRYAPPEVVRELARIALASLTAEPTVTFYRDGIEVAATWVDQQRESYDSEHGRLDPDTGAFEFGNDAQRDYSATLEEIAEGIRALHPNTAPPAPVVPTFDEWLEIRGNKPLGWVKDAMRESYDACRAAMLQGSQPVSKREQVRHEHAEWSDATFGNVGPVGPLKHLSKEALETAAEPDDLSEWADMQFLLWDAQRRAGISDGEITAAMEEKLKVNMARQWPEPIDGEPRLHIKADQQQEHK